MHILTDGESEDVLRRRQGKAEPPGVMADDLNRQRSCVEPTRSHREGRERICCVCKLTAHLFIYQPQCIFNVGVLQGDGSFPLGEEKSEDEVDDAVKAAAD